MTQSAVINQQQAEGTARAEHGAAADQNLATSQLTGFRSNGYLEHGSRAPSMAISAHLAPPLSDALQQAAAAVSPQTLQCVREIARNVGAADRPAFDQAMLRFLQSADTGPQRAQQVAAALLQMRQISQNSVQDTLKPRVSELLTSLTIELSNELRIHQSNTQLCAIASTWTDLAAVRPEEYARIWKELANNGRAELGCPGQFIDLHAGAVAADITFGRAERRLFTSRVIQAAGMEYASGCRYDAVRDVVYTPAGEVSGSYKEWHQRLRNAAFNEATVRIDTPLLEAGGQRGSSPPVDGGELLGLIERSLAQGKRVACEVVNYPGCPHGRHEVTIAGIETRDGMKVLKVRNTWPEACGGGYNYIPADEFTGRMLCCATIPTAILPENDARRSRSVLAVDRNPSFTPVYDEAGVLQLHARPPDPPAHTETHSADAGEESDAGLAWLKRQRKAAQEFAEQAQELHASGAPHGARAERSRSTDEESGGGLAI